MRDPRRLPFHLVNVFSIPDDPFSGNPLCVFDDGAAISESEMQALARQTNLSETTFILSPILVGATARVRIFTPTSEMPFAGHPTLGTAHVVRSLGRGTDEVVLELPAGLVRVAAHADRWTLETAHAPRTRVPEATSAALATMVGAPELGGPPLWVNTGVEQLVLPLRSVDDVKACKPSGALLGELAVRTEGDKRSAYVWAAGDDGVVLARYFFVQHGGVMEDPATGSACTNLGGWMLATGARQPVDLRVDQGAFVGRPSRLQLQVRDGRVFVGGEVTDVGRGEMVLPATP